MKITFTQFLFLLSLAFTTRLFAQAPPEILYYNFDGSGTTLPNLASSPPLGTTTATIIGAQTQGSVGLCGGALIGTGGVSTGNYVNTGWTTSLPGSWSISFWTNNIQPSATLYYIFGDVNATGFRCFTNGVAGANNWMLRGGFTDILITGGAVASPMLNTVVYDATTQKASVYLNAVLQSTVAQPAMNISGPGPFQVGGYSSNTGLSAGGLLDEFRVYSRALTPAEVQGLLTTVSITVAATSTAVCAGYTVGLTASGANSYTWAGSGNTGSTTVVTPMANTIYTVNGTTGGGCLGTGTINIAVNPGPAVSIAATSTALCTGGSSTLTASGVNSYTWGNSSQSNTISVSPSGTSTYSVSGTNSQGCISNAVATIVVNGSAPVLTISPASPSVCLGNTLTLTGSGALSYNWSSGITNATSFSPTATGTYSLSGTNGCGTTTTAITVTVSPLPVTISSTSTLVCAGSPATLTAGGATTFSWLPGTSTATNYIISPTTNTTYTLSGKTGVCTGSMALTVQTKTLPTLSIATPTTSICDGNSISLTAVGDAVTYSWSAGGNGPSISVSPANTSVYTVTGTNVVNCTKSVSQVITVNQNPVLSTSVSNPVVCSGGASTLAVSGAGTYSWSGSSVVTYSNVVNPTATTIYSVTGTNSSTGCYTTAAITVEVFEPPLAVSNNTTICTGANVTIGASGAITYTWINNSSTAQNINVAPTASTIYTVSGSVVDLQSGVTCDATSTIEVGVFTPPTITATSNHTAICRGATASLTADGAGATGTYTWTGGYGNTAVISVSPILDQSYNISGTDVNGCRGTASVQVVVSPCTGISQVKAGDEQIIIFPNPSNGDLTIQSEKPVQLLLINELGQQVQAINITAPEQKATLNNIVSGVYFIIGVNGNIRQKIVVAN